MVGIQHPYRRMCRQFKEGTYNIGLLKLMVKHQGFRAGDPGTYIRSFLLIQKDLQTLFEYIEPADSNSDCHSTRIHELLVRACIEFEANCKAILEANEYPKSKREQNIWDYQLIAASHRLPSYQVQLPHWRGTKGIRKPFEGWTAEASPAWYRAYNHSKHDRQENFAKATFEHAVNAVCGLAAILSAQFHTFNFMPDTGYTLVAGGGEFESAIGDYFTVRFPADWPPEERYCFDGDNWHAWRLAESDPFQNYPYEPPPRRS